MTEKEAYREKVEAQLESLDARIDLLKAKAKEAKADAKMKYEEQFENLRQKRQTVRTRLDELGEKGEQVWKELKSGVEDALDDLQNAIDSAVAQLEA